MPYSVTPGSPVSLSGPAGRPFSVSNSGPGRITVRWTSVSSVQSVTLEPGASLVALPTNGSLTVSCDAAATFTAVELVAIRRARFLGVGGNQTMKVVWRTKSGARTGQPFLATVTGADKTANANAGVPGVTIEKMAATANVAVPADVDRADVVPVSGDVYYDPGKEDGTDGGFATGYESFQIFTAGDQYSIG
jgi:hypothetical protein